MNNNQVIIFAGSCIMGAGLITFLLGAPLAIAAIALGIGLTVGLYGVFKPN